MSYFEDVYVRRINRYGIDYKTRVQGQREKEFSNYLERSIYRIDFQFEDKFYPGIFEKYKQDETESLHYLLTERYLNLPNGTLIMVKNKDGIEKPWMVYWMEEIPVSGYNKYVMLRMTHLLKWEDNDKEMHESWAYMYGQEDNMLKDELKSRSRSAGIYTENLKLNFFVLPLNEYIQKDNYFEIGEGKLKSGYRVTGYDIQSTPGVEYVSVDPVYLFDKSNTPEKTESDKADDYFWISGGVE